MRPEHSPAHAGRFCLILLPVFVVSSCGPLPAPPFPAFEEPVGTIELAFSVASDMRDYTGTNRRHFRGAAERLADGGAGDFMVSVGDLDPPADTFNTIATYVSPDYGWFPVVGNHEAETETDMAYIRGFDPGGPYAPADLRPGPTGGEETTYSFNAGGIHFVILNQYYDDGSDVATTGDITDSLIQWLEDDFASHTQAITLVFGHEPAYVMPDAESGRVRHEGDSLDQYPENRDRFWAALETAGVTAYVCGHTHNYSVEKFGTVWQVDSGHSRGLGDAGAPSTFLMFYAMADGALWLHPYRMNAATHEYTLRTRVQLR